MDNSKFFFISVYGCKESTRKKKHSCKNQEHKVGKNFNNCIGFEFEFEFCLTAYQSLWVI